MKITLIDLKESPSGCNNKDKTGGFGNAMGGRGLFSKVYSTLKKRHVVLPVHHFGYLAAIFRQAGHEVQYADGPPKENFDIALLASSIVGYDEEVAFARSLRENYSGKIGFFGPFASVKPDIFLAAADFIIEGEPEWAAIQMAQGKLSPAGFIPNRLIQNLDELPLPDWSCFPVHEYDYRPLLKPKPVLPMLTSRGCSFDCGYCPYIVMQTKTFRKHSIGRIMKEMAELTGRYGVKSIVFRDIIFSLHKKHTMDLCRAMLASGVKVQWSCETRADCLDEKLLDTMREAGLEAIHLGIESPDEDVLKKSGRKPIKEEHQERIITHCEKLGIKVAAFYIIGFFADTFETMRRTLDYAKRLNTSMAQFDIMTPYPGTRFFEQSKNRIVVNNWKKFNNYTSVLRLDHLSNDQLMDFKDRAYRDYYLRWNWFAKNGWKVLFQ